MENFNRKIDIAGLKYTGKYGRGLCTMRNILNTKSIIKIFKIVSLLIAILFESPNLSGAADFGQPEAQWTENLAKHVSWHYYRRGYHEIKPCGIEHPGLEGVLFAVPEHNMSWLQEYIVRSWTIVPTDITPDRINHNVRLYVRRPNHGLAHAMRVVYSALDIIDALNSPMFDNFQLTEAINLRRWVQNKLEDPQNGHQFKKKVAYMAAYVKSGRQSEISERNADTTRICPTCYNQYKKYDALNFSHDAPQSGLFTGAEIENYSKAFLPPQDNNNVSEDTFFMKKILDGAHNADLRRLYDFPGAISEELFGINLTYGSNENLFCSRPWNRSVEYIVATGEKYKVSGMNNPHPTMQWDGIWPEQFNSRTSSYKYTEDFVMQAYRPELMVNALNRTRDALNQNSNLNFNY